MIRKEKFELERAFKTLLSLRKELLKIDNKGIRVSGVKLEKYKSILEFLTTIMWFEAYYVDNDRLRDSIKGFG